MAQDILSQFNRAYQNPIETNRQVATITARNNISSLVRWEGMLVYVVAENDTYILIGGIDNADWATFAEAQTVIVEDNLTSTSTTNALSANQGRILDTTKIGDAPADTFQYVRVDNAWALNTGGTHTHTTSDITDLALYTGLDVRYYTETEIDTQATDYELLANKGSANGYVPLNGSSLIDSSYLPSYVDDVLEFANFASFPGTGETGKIYVDLALNELWRWSGSVYVQVGGTGAVTWGGITGTLSNQTDLQSALDGKANS